MKNNPHDRIDAVNIKIERSQRIEHHLAGALQIYNTRECMSGVEAMSKRIKYEKEYQKGLCLTKKHILDAIHILITTSDNTLTTLERLGYNNLGWSNSWSIKKRQAVRINCQHTEHTKTFFRSPTTEWTFCHECKTFYRSTSS